MAGFTIENDNGGVGFSTLQELANSMISDLTTNGFTLMYPASFSASVYSATMEASLTVDPLQASQPWRFRIDADGTSMKLFVATALQLDDLGNTVVDPERTNHQVGEVSHGVQHNYSPDVLTSGPYDFIPDGKVSASTPFSYRLSITDRGFVMVVWQHSDAEIVDYSWICVQRPVDNSTGATVVAGKAPVFCVFHNMGTSERMMDSYPYSRVNWRRPIPGSNSSTAGVADLENGIFRFTVRESDIFRPSLPRSATSHFPDSTAIMNENQQISITENNQYVITFPANVNTARYAYTHELDMIAYTSADVISQWSDASITVYGEGSARTYKALMHNQAGRDPALQPFIWGMRLLVLTAGGGI